MDFYSGNAPVPVDPPQGISFSKRELGVQDALLYLDEVRMVFASQPEVFNQLVDLMKSFKAHTINTSGVIETVKMLFKGHSKLILGFNAFLPDEAVIRLTAEEIETDKQYAVTNRTISPLVSIQQQQQSRVPLQALSQEQQKSHAINYVRKIERRFQTVPEIYRSFLAILHTYKKEQKGIKDVLEQLSILFADHPDLLMDFTYFLPDNVQLPGQAVVELNVLLNSLSMGGAGL